MWLLVGVEQQCLLRRHVRFQHFCSQHLDWHLLQLSRFFRQHLGWRVFKLGNFCC